MIGKTAEGSEVTMKPLNGGHMCLVANTGAGKSYTLRKILEESRGETIQIVLDPEGEFHTLTDLAPYEVIGGRRLPDPARLAHRVISRGTSVIIQLDRLDLNGQRRFIDRFIRALIELPRNLWRRAVIVIDEAHRFCPQSGRCESTEAVVMLMAQGRKRGFSGLLATQRLAKLNKNAAGEASNWLIGRVGQRIDRNLVADMLGVSPRSDEALGLMRLEVGQMWAFGPAFDLAPQLVRISPAQTRHLSLDEPGPARNGGDGLSLGGWIVLLTILGVALAIYGAWPAVGVITMLVMVLLYANAVTRQKRAA